MGFHQVHIKGKNPEKMAPDFMVPHHLIVNEEVFLFIMIEIKIKKTMKMMIKKRRKKKIIKKNLIQTVIHLLLHHHLKMTKKK